jgi:hypothetical protein
VTKPDACITPEAIEIGIKVIARKRQSMLAYPKTLLFKREIMLEGGKFDYASYPKSTPSTLPKQ